MLSPAQPVFSSTGLYACKTKFSLIGTVGAGKSTTAALIALTTQTLSSSRTDFFCRIIERNSNIYGDVANLRMGKFPEKTVAYNQFATESGLLLARKSTFGMKQLQMPICDVAGEDLQLTIKQYANALGPIGNAAYSAAFNTTRYVKECDGMILITDASRVILDSEGSQIKSEDDSHLHKDPDVNLVRMLNDVFDYREQMRKPLKGIAVVITKWDVLKPHVERLGLDLFNPSQQDMATFMDTFYPSVAQAVKSYLLTNKTVSIQYFPTYVEIDRNEDGSEKKWADGKPKVKPKASTQISDMRKPSYSEQSYANLIEWLLGFAM
jgi:hypothetical protein